MRKTPTLSVPMAPREAQLGWFYFLLHLLVIPGLVAEAFRAFFPDGADAQMNFLFYLVNFGAVLGIFHSFLQKSWKTAAARASRFLAVTGLGFLCYWAASQLLGRGILLLRPDFANVNDQSIVQMGREDFLLTAVGTVLLVPPAEECLYRGLIFRSLHARSRWLAYLVSTLLFCSIHVLGYLGAFDAGTLALCFVQYIPAGLCLAWAYETADTIFSPVLIHTVVNALGILTMLR